MTQKLLSDEELREAAMNAMCYTQHKDYFSRKGEIVPSGANVDAVVDLINTQKRLYAEMTISLDAEALMRVGNKSDNHRSHVPAYKAIIEEQMARIK